MSHVVVRASAGAGKTFQLTNRFLGLLMRGVAVDAILASTFSRKAAGEIVERVLTRLAKAALRDEDARALAQALSFPHLQRVDFEQKLSHVAARLHRLSIGTLDAFFMGLAQSFGAELGFMPGWRVLDEAVENTLRRRAVTEALQTHADDELAALLAKLSRGEQRQSVVERLDKLFKDAYATYVSSDEAAWLPAQHSQAAPTIADALLALERVPVADAKLKLVRDEDVARARHDGAEGLLDKGLAKKLAEGDAMYLRKPIPLDLQRAYADVFAAYAVQIRAEVQAQTRATFVVTRAIAEALWQAKAVLRGYGFDDVSRILAKRVTDAAPALDEMFFRLDQRIQYLMLDEFQDTSLAQWAVLRPLATEISSHRDGQHGFYCVGDVKQAIYGWRGGVRQIFDAITQELAGVETQTLDKSYRSSPVIMEAVNRLFGSLDVNAALDGYVTSAWSRGFSPHATARQDLPGYVRILAAKSDLLVDAADEIAALHRAYPAYGIGVLVRSNEAVAALIGLLSARQVRASEEGGNPLTDTRVVTLLLSALCLADHPGDTVSRYHVARSPLGAPLGLPDWRDWQAAERVSTQLRARVAAVGLGQTLRELVSLLQPAPSGRDKARLEQLVELGERFAKQTLPDAQQALRLMRFVEFVRQTKMEEPSTASVRVMTIHQAKGLEFDIVVATDLEDDIFKTRPLLTLRTSPVDPPTRVSRDLPRKQRVLLPELQEMAAQADQRELDEALSNLYVTVTRARQAFHAVIQPSSASEKTPRKTLAGILRAGLAPGQRAEAGQVVYELGEPLPAREAIVKPVRVLEAPQIQLRASGRRPQRLSPSGLEGGAHIDVREHLRLERKAPLQHGAQVHAWLEQVEWAEDVRDDAPPELRKLLSQPTVRKVLSRATFADQALRVYRELPFALREGEDLLSGKLDRVVVEDGKRVTVIDFKTDRAQTDAEIAARVAYYKPQIDAYRLAASRVFQVPIDAVAGWLLFLSADRLEEIQNARVTRDARATRKDEKN